MAESLDLGDMAGFGDAIEFVPEQGSHYQFIVYGESVVVKKLKGNGTIISLPRAVYIGRENAEQLKQECLDGKIKREKIFDSETRKIEPGGRIFYEDAAGYFKCSKPIKEIKKIPKTEAQQTSQSKKDTEI